MKTKKQEKGALLVEVIAVLGLIALMTPILFEQIQKRNEEIINTQVASEMRALKEALSNYIQANEAFLAEDCGLMGDNGEYTASNKEECNVDWANEAQAIADARLFAGNTSILDDYDVKFYGKTVPSGASDYRPVIYAVAYQKDPMPNLRRASKTAALIGVEGGVVTNNSGHIDGMQGVWTLNIEGALENAVAVTTSFDTVTNSAILKDATFSNMQASNSVQAPIIAGGRVGVMDIFTVSGDDCIIDYGSDTIEIRANEDRGCAPVFEVDAGTHEVHIAGVIKTGKIPTDHGDCALGTSRATCEAIKNCIWIENDQNGNNCINEYLLNPAETSLMNDIKLASRDGANLSEILPKWSLMRVRSVTDDGNVNSTISCPDGYNRGIIVLPSRINRAANSAVSITTGMMSGNGTVTVNVDGLADGEKVIVQEYCVYTH